MKLRNLLPIVAMLAPVGAWAQGVAMEPGKWEMTTTMTMSMMPAPQVRTVTECYTEDEFDPEKFNTNPDSTCATSDIEVDGQTITWNIVCPTEMGNMEGKWSFVSGGDTVSGTGDMSANMGDQVITFNMIWKGKRVGDCD